MSDGRAERVDGGREGWWIGMVVEVKTGGDGWDEKVVFWQVMVFLLFD